MINALIRDEDDFVKAFFEKVESLGNKLYGYNLYYYDYKNYNLEDPKDVNALAIKIYKAFIKTSKNRIRLFKAYYSYRYKDSNKFSLAFISLCQNKNWAQLDERLIQRYQLLFDDETKLVRKVFSKSEYFYFNKDQFNKYFLTL